ncbi:MAG TPA: glutathione S-transferase family protein [Steroidobacteraceae bacterium]|nr:glutathione S-transferase family protein [Steroidobacteraceae bacterium]
MSLKLYMHPVSTVSRPVSLFIAEKALPVSQQVVDLMTGEHHQPAYIAINPNKAVPALEDGDFRISESSAILKYLAARFDAPEYPKDLKERAKVDSIMDWFNTGFYKDFGYGLLYPQIFPHHKRPTDDLHTGTISWGKGKAKDWLTVLDKDILGKDDYVANNRISIADYFGVCLLTAGELIGCKFEGYPNVQRWVNNMKKLGSWPKVNEVMYGFAGSMADKQFETV